MLFDRVLINMNDKPSGETLLLKRELKKLLNGDKYQMLLDGEEEALVNLLRSQVPSLPALPGGVAITEENDDCYSINLTDFRRPDPWCDEHYVTTPITLVLKKEAL